ncbi:Plant transposase (Ptta/En/Spm family) [Carex littledalei]|uniref:Plant transposase (Ptta/En/Spm family) n=1 Tax=Carex littledalei TaxID=544730 RepID=A0A833V8P0_9POAL|nr:Plant transposase (Ptta/En/Spm family) [Carex littledalei]
MPITRSGKIVGKTIGVPSRSAAAAKRQRKDLEQPLSTMLVEEELNQFSAKHKQVEEELNHFSAKHKTVGVYTRRCTRTKRDKLVGNVEHQQSSAEQLTGDLADQPEDQTGNNPVLQTGVHTEKSHQASDHSGDMPGGQTVDGGDQQERASEQTGVQQKQQQAEELPNSFRPEEILNEEQHSGEHNEGAEQRVGGNSLLLNINDDGRRRVFRKQHLTDWFVIPSGSKNTKKVVVDNGRKRYSLRSTTVGESNAPHDNGNEPSADPDVRAVCNEHAVDYEDGGQTGNGPEQQTEGQTDSNHPDEHSDKILNNEPHGGEHNEGGKQRVGGNPLLLNIKDDGLKRHRQTLRTTVCESFAQHNVGDEASADPNAPVEGNESPNLNDGEDDQLAHSDGEDSSTSGVSRKRKGRGPSKQRKPAPPSKRPLLYVVGLKEFQAVPVCKKIVTTIRILTCKAMPGPFRSYNQFSTTTLAKILTNFLKIYSWGENQDVKVCVDVFEKIAAEVYCRELTERRQELALKINSKNPEDWKLNPPHWCPDPAYWRGLCDIWKQKGWQIQSLKNKANKDRDGGVIHHVGGSRSTFGHLQVLKAERGGDVGLKEVFDKIHQRKGTGGPVYVNKKVKDFGESFEKCRKQPEVEGKSDMELWTEVVGGPRRGKIFGLGGRSIKLVDEGATSSFSKTGTYMSTSTSSTPSIPIYTAEEADRLLVEERKLQERKMIAHQGPLC